MALCVRARTLCRACVKTPLLNPKSVLVQGVAHHFHEPDRKGGYGKSDERPMKEIVQEGLQMMGPEMKKWKQEWVNNFHTELFIPLEPLDYEVIWKFDNKEAVHDWIVTSDLDHNEGKSTAEFFLGRNKTGIFQGNLKTETPKDGVIKRSGYCNIKSPKNYKSFKRAIPYDWEGFTHLIMRVRGDGRAYQLTLQQDRYFDTMWNDLYSYALFTKGGPYWQTAKIPFSRFFMTSKGRIQDKQEHIPMDRIGCFGITCGDGYPGPFQLEIDYIGLQYDPSHLDQFPYEMYATPTHLLY